MSKSKQKSMNNFYTKLPGGFGREYAGRSVQYDRLFGEIDRLLKTEFRALPVNEILAAISKSEDVTVDALNRRTFRKEYRKIIGPMQRAARVAYEKLRPLFNRLVELGFDAEFLRE